MPRITRASQKIFGSNSANNGQFGSAADGTKQISNDVEVLQALPAYIAGWAAAVISGEKLPTLEEMQALDYINTYQLSYLFQEGIPEYDDGTTYYTASIVKEPGGYTLYASLGDNNTGNALNTGSWKAIFNINGPGFAKTVTPADGAATPSVLALLGQDGLIVYNAAAAPFNVTNITDAVSGQRIALKNLGASNITLTRANSFLDGGTDKVLATNQIINLVYDGAKWNQISPVLTIS